MNAKRRSIKWLITLMAAGMVYAILWYVTEIYGVPQVRQAAVDSVRQPFDPSAGDGPVEYPVYRCSAGAYAPLVVRADYQWQSGPRSGDGATLYLWLFGRTWRVREMSHRTS